ncbi:unnamed protein product [Adineta steineri]|uniref:Uncharacterized protein n=1 Tax=Adineta steineri TaxID=433720 RepID=A0A813QA84_9BILA|nr:unnamed protein product [Adineta steineri]CAF1032211.1 unnamed protein product [Adineta steineri]
MDTQNQEVICVKCNPLGDLGLCEKCDAQSKEERYYETTTRGQNRKKFHFATLVSNNEAELVTRLLTNGVLLSFENYIDYSGQTPMH